MIRPSSNTVRIVRSEKLGHQKDSGDSWVIQTYLHNVFDTLEADWELNVHPKPRSKITDVNKSCLNKVAKLRNEHQRYHLARSQDHRRTAVLLLPCVKVLSHKICNLHYNAFISCLAFGANNVVSSRLEDSNADWANGLPSSHLFSPQRWVTPDFLLPTILFSIPLSCWPDCDHLQWQCRRRKSICDISSVYCFLSSFSLGVENMDLLICRASLFTVLLFSPRSFVYVLASTAPANSPTR